MRPVSLSLSIAAALTALVGCPAAALPTPSTSSPGDAPSAVQRSAPDLRVTFDTSAGPDGSFESLDNQGTASLAVRVVAIDGGEVLRKRSRTGGTSNGSARMPLLDPTADAPRAVVRVLDVGGADNLDPGTGDFAFGAAFRLDDDSEDTSAGSVDNGDNLVQRGGYNAVSQFKIQLDHRRAMCRVSGSAGTVTVSADQLIDPNIWYRVRCARIGDVVVLRLTRFVESGSTQSWVSRERGMIGSLTPDDRSVPLSIGGKLAPNGTLVDSADQFNGRIDNAFLDIR